MTDLDIKQWFSKYGGWVVIWVLVSIPLLRWFSINSFEELYGGWYASFSTLGKLFGLAGFMLYAINLLLATRLRVLENFFLGLNRVYMAHHITGGISLALIMFHPFFLAIRSITLSTVETFGTAATFLLPRTVDTSLSYAEVQEAIAINAGIIAFWGMVVLLFITFFVKLPYRFWLFTHRFLGVAFLFSGLHIIFVNSDAYRDVPMKIYLILWLVIGIASYMYRTVLGNIFVKRSPYRVITVAENNSVIGMELEPMQKKIDFKPGQFVFIRFRWADEEGIISEAHPFSIASGESEGVIRLYVKALGDYTAGLKLLKPGTIAEIEGAFGRFVPANYGSAPQVWIAGGIGITPYLSMVRSLQEMPQQIYLIHSVKTQEEIAEKHVLQDLIPQNYPNFKFIPFVSDEMGKFIDAEFIDQQVGGLAGKEIFICGPPPMMKSLRAQLNQRGIPNRRIHSEEFAMT